MRVQNREDILTMVCAYAVHSHAVLNDSLRNKLLSIASRTLRNKLFSFVLKTMDGVSEKLRYRCRSGVSPQCTTLGCFSRALFKS